MRALAGARLLVCAAMPSMVDVGPHWCTLAAWTRTRPGSTEEQRKKFKDRRPTVADWSYQYERSGGFNGRGPDLMVGQSRFGAGSVETMFIAEPHTMLKSQCIRCSAHH